MDAQHIGLSSLTKRILELEEQLKNLNMPAPETDFMNDIVHQQKKKHEAKRKLELDKIYEHYTKGLLKHLGTFSGDLSDHLLLILQYSIIYVEKNISKIAKTIGTEVEASFKLDTCISLVQSVEHLKETFNQVFLENCVNFLVHMLYNNPKIERITDRIIPPAEPPVDDLGQAGQPGQNTLPKRRKSVCSKISKISVSSLHETGDDLQLLDPRREKKSSGIGKYLMSNSKGK